MRLAFVVTAMAGLALGPSAHAADGKCTDKKLREQQSQLRAFVNRHPDQQQGVIATIAEVESEYGGEPSPEKMCEAMDKVLSVLLGKPRSHGG